MGGGETPLKVVIEGGSKENPFKGGYRGGGRETHLRVVIGGEGGRPI